MSIVDSRADRHAASATIDRMKDMIAALQLDIDIIFSNYPIPLLETMKKLGEIDVHLARARVELGEAQTRILNLP